MLIFASTAQFTYLSRPDKAFPPLMAAVPAPTVGANSRCRWCAPAHTYHTAIVHALSLHERYHVIGADDNPPPVRALVQNAVPASSPSETRMLGFEDEDRDGCPADDLVGEVLLVRARLRASSTPPKSRRKII